MITLFVVQSCADAKDPTNSINSFKGLVDEVYNLASLKEVNGTDRGDWYAVIYDDENINEELLEGLKVFVDETEADVLVLFRLRDGKFYRSPRVFRRHITIKNGSLMPEQDVKFETVLNGWILPND